MEDNNLENIVKDKAVVKCYLKGMIEDKALIHVDINGENHILFYPKKELEDAGIKERTYFKIVPYKEEDTDKIILQFVPSQENSSNNEDYASTTRISVGSWWHKQKN
ncbi:MAG: hypothetical protein QW666_00055 [Candidatus Woesearchaeota archaeon]